jgi:Tol biopolymer transport system component
VRDGKAAGDPFLIQEGMANNKLGNWTVHGLVSWNWIKIRDIFSVDVNPLTGAPVGSPRQLDYTPSGGNVCPDFAPGGNRLAFVRVDHDEEKSYLVVKQLDDGKIFETELPEGTNPRSLSWTPDGSCIGIYSFNHVWEPYLNIYHFEDEELETIPYPTGGWSRFEWSNSDRSFYYNKNGLIIEDSAGIYEYNIDSGKEKYIYRPQEAKTVTFRSLKCSQDYSQLAFTENSYIKVLDLASGESSEVSNNLYGHPSWSPDGKSILSIGPLSPEESERKTIWVISLSGGSFLKYDLGEYLPEDGEIWHHDWSPDGTQLVFVLNQNVSEHLIYKNIVPESKK